MDEIDVAIVGGGINGLLIAYELANTNPDYSVALFEKEKFVGEHQSARNSGVLHAGIYYPLDSLKRKFCIEGNHLWRELAKKLEIEINPCGKYIICQHSHQEKELEALYQRAVENGVSGVSWVQDKKIIEKISQYAHVHKAFFSSTTAIINTSKAIKNIEKELYKKECPVLLNDEVKKISFLGPQKYRVETDREEIQCKVLILAAGPFNVGLRKQLGLKELEDDWTKGHYLKYQAPFFNESLIYPLPLKNLKGLGVHTSFDIDGMVRFGPNAVDTNSIDYSMDEGVLETMSKAISEVFKGVKHEKLSLDYAGVRSKIKYNGEPFNDFWIKSDEKGLIELCGVDSPGLTSSPAIAKFVQKMVYSQLN